MRGVAFRASQGGPRHKILPQIWRGFTWRMHFCICNCALKHMLAYFHGSYHLSFSYCFACIFATDGPTNRQRLLNKYKNAYESHGI